MIYVGSIIHRIIALMISFFQLFFFFSSRRRHTRCREVSWARRCVQETVSTQSTWEFLVGELDATDKYDSDALLERKAVFNDKEYEIWRYTSKRLASYTFFDVNMNNGHKLIYVYNDDDIPVSSDYKFYLGQDFDEERLKQITKSIIIMIN
eukprot:TRINITY_DN25248_c0_g1_i1.p2 TRINITY_DN25248_c0_g1~~TRINITY_DN25248_c0_g1_i1.p2  ORF type:complete len:151 (-),score=42.26 TRINITY_DN25248_c0_g1_i1:326-778(-)